MCYHQNQSELNQINKQITYYLASWQRQNFASFYSGGIYNSGNNSALQKNDEEA